MLAAQAALREGGLGSRDNEDEIAEDEKMDPVEKREVLQKALHRAASNGDMERVRRILEGKARRWVEINEADEEGTSPLIYASCFVSAGCVEGAWGMVEG